MIVARNREMHDITQDSLSYQEVLSALFYLKGSIVTYIKECHTCSSFPSSVALMPI